MKTLIVALISLPAFATTPAQSALILKCAYDEKIQLTKDSGELENVPAKDREKVLKCMRGLESKIKKACGSIKEPEEQKHCVDEKTKIPQ